MLVVSRFEGERIMVGDDIVIEIVRVHGQKVRVGVSAPRHIQVHREEVYNTIKAGANPQIGMADATKVDGR